jgi:hypothetical protein
VSSLHTKLVLIAIFVVHVLIVWPPSGVEPERAQYVGVGSARIEVAASRLCEDCNSWLNVAWGEYIPPP